MTKKLIVFLILTSIIISTTTGLLWSIFYWLYSRNSPTTYKVFLYSSIGGLLGSIVGLFVGYLVGTITVEKETSSFFIGGGGITEVFWGTLFWIIGTIEGAILGGLIFIRIYFRYL